MFQYSFALFAFLMLQFATDASASFVITDKGIELSELPSSSDSLAGFSIELSAASVDCSCDNVSMPCDCEYYMPR